MIRTAVLEVSDTQHTVKWIGSIAALESSHLDYKHADLRLIPTARLFRPRAVGFECVRIWFSFTNGKLYEQVFFFKPRLLSELVNAYDRFEQILFESKDWHTLRNYPESERINKQLLREQIN